MPKRTPELLRRIARSLLALGVVAASLVLTAVPAGADPAVPSNYRAEVVALDPPSSAVTLRVTGGDSFLTIEVESGHEVSFLGYFAEPYFEVRADGGVYVNELAPTKYVNEDRYGLTPTPGFADAAAEPQWVLEASNGRYSWHDHRTHWMSDDRPPNAGGSNPVVLFPWEVPLTIDGVETIAEGQLTWYPSVTPIPWIVIGLAALIPLVLWRRSMVAAALTTALAVALLAAVSAWQLWLATPALARGAPAGVVAPLWGAVFLALALALWGLGAVSWSPRAGLLGAAALVYYGITSFDILVSPVLPAALPDPLERFAVAAALIAGVVALVVLGREVLLPASMRTPSLRPEA